MSIKKTYSLQLLQRDSTGQLLPTLFKLTDSFLTSNRNRRLHNIVDYLKY